MLTLRKSAMAALLLATFGTSGMARAMVIDLFNEAGTPVVIAIDGWPVNTLAVTAYEGNAAWNNVIGDARDLSSYITAGTSTLHKVSTFVSDGFFQSTRSASTQGVSKVRWDGNADGIFSTTGLGSLDLTMDGATLFELVVAYDNRGGAIDLTLWDSVSAASGVTSSFASLNNTSTSSTYTLAFTAFNSIDFTDIQAIELSLGGNGRMVRIDSLTTNGAATNNPIPEPATLALLGLGLIGLGFSRRARLT